MQAALQLAEEWDPWALTLKLPWSWCMAHAPEEVRKRVENRDWPPWPRISSGQWFLLHAGAAYDDVEAELFIREIIGRSPPSLKELRASGQAGALLAFARVVDVTMGGTHLSPDQKRWFFGPYGWVLDVRPLAQPIPCRGWHKLWRVEAQLRKDNTKERAAEIVRGLRAERMALAA